MYNSIVSTGWQESSVRFTTGVNSSSAKLYVFNPLGPYRAYCDDLVLRSARSCTLTVVNGTGSGIYTEGDVVAITADTSNSRRFSRWHGDLHALSDTMSTTTHISMISSSIEVEALFDTSTAVTSNNNTTTPSSMVTASPTARHDNTLKVYDCRGRLISLGESTNALPDLRSALQNQPKGLYFAITEYKGKRTINKVIVQ